MREVTVEIDSEPVRYLEAGAGWPWPSNSPNKRQQEKPSKTA